MQLYITFLHSQKRQAFPLWLLDFLQFRTLSSIIVMTYHGGALSLRYNKNTEKNNNYSNRCINS